MTTLLNIADELLDIKATISTVEFEIVNNGYSYNSANASNSTKFITFDFDIPNYEEADVSSQINFNNAMADLSVNVTAEITYSGNTKANLSVSSTWSYNYGNKKGTLEIGSITSTSALPYNRELTLKISLTATSPDIDKVFAVPAIFILVDSGNEQFTFQDSSNNVFVGVQEQFTNVNGTTDIQKIVDEFLDIRNEINTISVDSQITRDPRLTKMLDTTTVDVSAQVFETYATDRFSGEPETFTSTGTLKELLDYVSLERKFGFNFDVPSKYVITYSVVRDNGNKPQIFNGSGSNKITKIFYVIPKVSVEYDFLEQGSGSKGNEFELNKQPTIRPLVKDHDGNIDIELTKNLYENASFTLSKDGNDLLPNVLLDVLNNAIDTSHNKTSGTYNVSINYSGLATGVEKEMWDYIFNEASYASQLSGVDKGAEKEHSNNNAIPQDLSFSFIPPRLENLLTITIDGSDNELKSSSPSLVLNLSNIDVSHATVTSSLVTNTTINYKRYWKVFEHDNNGDGAIESRKLNVNVSSGSQIDINKPYEYYFTVSGTDANGYEHSNTFTLKIYEDVSGTLSDLSGGSVDVTANYGVVTYLENNKIITSGLENSQMTYISQAGDVFEFADSKDKQLFDYSKVSDISLNIAGANYTNNNGNSYPATGLKALLSNEDLHAIVNDTSAPTYRIYHDLLTGSSANITGTIELEDGSLHTISEPFKVDISLGGLEHYAGSKGFATSDVSNSYDSNIHFNVLKWSNLGLGSQFANTSTLMEFTYVDNYGHEWSYSSRTSDSREVFELTTTNTSFVSAASGNYESSDADTIKIPFTLNINIENTFNGNDGDGIALPIISNIPSVIVSDYETLEQTDISYLELTDEVINVDATFKVTVTLDISDSWVSGNNNNGAFTGLVNDLSSVTIATFTITNNSNSTVTVNENKLFTIDLSNQVDGVFNGLYGISQNMPVFKLSDGLDFFQPNSSATFQGSITINSDGTPATKTGTTDISYAEPNIITVEISGNQESFSTNNRDGITLDICDNIAAALLHVDLRYAARRNISTVPSNINLSDVSGALVINRLAVYERASAVETVGAENLIQVGDSRFFTNNSKVSTASTTRTTVKEIPRSIQLAANKLPSNWLDTLLDNMHIGHWDGYFSDNLTFNTVDVSSNRSLLLKAVEFYIDESSQILDNSTNPIIAKAGVSYQYRGISGEELNTNSFESLAQANSSDVFKTEHNTLYDTIVRIDESGVKIWRRLTGDGNNSIVSDSNVTIQNIINEPELVNSTTSGIGLDSSELSAIKRIRAEIEYDLKNGIENDISGVDFINRAVISLPDENMITDLSNGTLTELRASSTTQNAWDLENNDRKYKYYVENVLAVTSVEDNTMGKLLISNDPDKLNDLSNNPSIAQVHVGSNTVQFNVSMDASGTLAEQGLTDAFMALFDLSGIDILNSSNPDVIRDLGSDISIDSSYNDRLKAYLGTDGSASNFIYWEMVPHSDALYISDANVDSMSIKYDISDSSIGYEYPIAHGDRLSQLAQHIHLSAYNPAKYKIVLYLREGAAMRNERGVATNIVGVNLQGYRMGETVVYNPDGRNSSIDIRNPDPIDTLGGLSSLENTVNGASKSTYAVLNIIVRSPLELLTFSVSEHDSASGLNRVEYEGSFNDVQISVNRSDGSANILDFSSNDATSDSPTERQNLVHVSGLYSPLVKLHVDVSGHYYPDYYNMDVSSAVRTTKADVSNVYVATLGDLSNNAHSGVTYNSTLNKYTINTDVLLFNSSGNAITGLNRAQPGSFTFKFNLSHDFTYANGANNAGIRIVDVSNPQTWQGDLSFNAVTPSLLIVGYDAEGDIRNITAYKYGIADSLPFSNEQGVYTGSVDVVDTTLPQLKFNYGISEGGATDELLVDTKHVNNNTYTHTDASYNLTIAPGAVSVSHSTLLQENYEDYKVYVKNVVLVDNAGMMSTRYSMDNVFEEITTTDNVLDFKFDFDKLLQVQDISRLNIKMSQTVSDSRPVMKAAIIEVIGYVVEGDKHMLVGPKTLIFENGTTYQPSGIRHALTTETTPDGTVAPIDPTQFANSTTLKQVSSTTINRRTRGRMIYLS
jgi:hypothetical protein